jgi:hypothetical protein
VRFKLVMTQKLHMQAILHVARTAKN